MSGASFLIWLLAIAIPIAVGYWCMTVFRRKGRSAGAGFALGFFLTLFLSVIGAAIALAISYTRSDRPRMLPPLKL